MMSELLDAIVRTHPWTAHFTRYEYREAFQEYSRRYAPLYAAAVQTEDVSVLAGEIVDALAQRRAGLHFWNRGAATDGHGVLPDAHALAFGGAALL